MHLSPCHNNDLEMHRNVECSHNSYEAVIHYRVELIDHHSYVTSHSTRSELLLSASFVMLVSRSLYYQPCAIASAKQAKLSKLVILGSGLGPDLLCTFFLPLLHVFDRHPYSIPCCYDCPHGTTAIDTFLPRRAVTLRCSLPVPLSADRVHSDLAVVVDLNRLIASWCATARGYVAYLSSHSQHNLKITLHINMHQLCGYNSSPTTPFP
jgi:hypothetical protein